MSAGCTYCLTAVDRLTRWPEVIPIPVSAADTAALALLAGWISRLGCPQTITTEQGRQFESQLFHSLVKYCGMHISRTSAHYPAANGLVERFHQTLKAAIMCHADQHLTEAPPLVLLDISTAFKAGLQASHAALPMVTLQILPYTNVTLTLASDWIILFMVDMGEGALLRDERN
jgi:cleavage and polyadenylation specificity factor subunit 1